MSGLIRPDWDDWLMGMCFWISLKSYDPATIHGAVLCDEKHRILGVGYNGFPRGCDDSKLPTTRPQKYDVMIHAEENCLLNSQGLLYDIGHTLYITGFPCPNCFTKIMQCGIQRVVYGPVVSSGSSRYADTEKIDIVHQLADMKCIDLHEYKGHISQRNIDLFKGMLSPPS